MLYKFTLLAVCVLLSGCIGIGGGYVKELNDKGELVDTFKHREWIFGLAAPKISIKTKSNTMAFSKNDAVDEVVGLLEKGVTAAIIANKGQ